MQAAAQTASGGWAEVYAGGELEEYLRVLQVSGKAKLYPWSIRGFSIREIQGMAPTSGHPWAVRHDLKGKPENRWEIRAIAPSVRSTFNSTFPFGWNDGLMWAGRGLSMEATAGVAARFGPISLSAAPIAFWAQNAEFPIVENATSVLNPFADPRHPTQIDLPQRFGDRPLQRIDPGQTTLRVDLAGLTIGLSSANQTWGPADDHPMILGVNAPGFLHGFAGTSRPMNLWLAKIHGRLIWGRLEQSEFSTVPADSASRFATGIVVALTPRGLPGLEIGGGRFFQMPWPNEGFSRTQLLAPVESFVKADLLDKNGHEIQASVLANQIVSAFVRWAFPASGVEFYGEFGTEDHRHNFRDALLEPDHDSAYTLALRKVWERDDGSLLSLRGELLNASASHLQRTRRQEPFYIHASTRQGHTQRGQLLGSPAAYGGAGSTVALDLYHRGGRATLEWRRMVRGELDQYLQTGEIDEPDVIHSLGSEILLFRGRWDITAGLTGVYEFNRDFEDDAVNLNAVLGVRAGL